MSTKGRPVPADEYGVMTALGQRPRLAVAHRAGQILVGAAPATWRLQMFWPG